MNLFGEDFQRARKSWLYPTYAMQHFWPAFGLVIFIFALFTLLQVAFGLPIGAVLFGLTLADLQSGTNPHLMQSVIIGVFPAACVVVPILLYLARFGMPDSLGRLPLSWPKLGLFGWALTLGAFFALMYGILFAAFALTGLDPVASRGEVEKAMVQLSSNKWQMAFVVPSLVLGAAFVEELVFRGILFAGIKQTRLGGSGAVIFTALIWASAHAGAATGVAIVALFVMGILLGLMLLRFGSLWVTIVAHGLWNALTTVFIFTQSV